MTSTLKAVFLCVALLLGLFSSCGALAQTDQHVAPLIFTDAHEETRFHDLSSELRCVMCQNQSLADSNAIIARDLRAEVLVLMRKGMTDAEIKTFLVQRYGEFVLYKPRMSLQNGLLWFGPLLLLLGGAVFIYRIVKKRKPVTTKDNSNDSDEGQEW